MFRLPALLLDSPLSKFAEVIDRYQREITPRKAERTQEDELGYLGKLRSVFGGMAPRDITPVMIAQLRDTLAAKHGAVQANHHLKTLKHLLKVATEWGAISHNPAREVSKLKVKPRERYVTDEELAAVRAKAPPMVAIDLAVLTGLRRGDLLSLTKDHLKDDGIHIMTAKTGRTSGKR
jgi:integrase